MFATPAGIVINAVFLLIWRALPTRLPEWSMRKRLAAVTLASVAAWAVMAIVVVLAMGQVRKQVVSLFPVGLGLTVTLAVLGIVACRNAPSAPKGTRKVGPVTLALRGILAATSIGGSVCLAYAGGALAAGVAAVFPAIFLTTMFSLWISQGEAVQAGAVGPMMLGATSVAAYAVLAAFALPLFGLAFGSMAAWVASAVAVTLPAALWLNRSSRPVQTAH